jgi:zinc protease
MQKILFPVLLFLSFALVTSAAEYTVVMSKDVQDDPTWKKVADALLEKHKALSPKTIVFEKDVLEASVQLKADIPTMTCFVVKPEQAGREFVAKIHTMTRVLDNDPFTDTRWGIITGYDAEAALKVAEYDKPLEVRKVAAATGFNLNRFDEGIQWSEGSKNSIVKKEKGKPAVASKDGPDDPTADMVKMFNENPPDLWFTSGHATEHDWMIGYSYRAGFFVHKDGVIHGKPLSTPTPPQGGNKLLPIHSPNPKVFMPVGNCLIGHVDKADCMATSFFKSAGVIQMFGYTVPSWFGYGGWGVGEYFIDQPGRYTFNEAFFANQVALDYCLASYLQQHPDVKLDGNVNMQQLMQGGHRDLAGLLYDRQTVAFYGDPAWVARTMQGKCQWEQTLDSKNKQFVLTITGGNEPEEKISGESQPWKEPRPIVQWLPKNLKNVKLVEGKEFNPVITENFILVPRKKIVGNMRIVIEGE